MHAHAVGATQCTMHDAHLEDNTPLELGVSQHFPTRR